MRLDKLVYTFLFSMCYKVVLKILVVDLTRLIWNKIFGICYHTLRNNWYGVVLGTNFLEALFYRKVD